MNYKLLILTIPDSHSGVSRHTNSLAKILGEDKQFTPFLIKHWIRQNRENDKKEGYTLCDYMNKEIDFDLDIVSLISRMKERKIIPDLIHIHTTTYGSDNVLDYILVTFHTPVIYTAHAILKYINLDRDIKKKILSGENFMLEESLFSNQKEQEKLLKISNKITLISDTHQKIFNRIYNEHSDKTVSMPNFTDFGEFFKKNKEIILQKGKEIKKKYCDKNSQKMLAYCGRLEEQKGIAKISELLNFALKKNPEIKFLFIGSIKKGETQEDLRNVLADKYNLKEDYKKFVFGTKWIDNKIDLASHFKATDALVQPVFSPNLYGLAALETLCADTPLITCKGELSFGNTLTKNSFIKTLKKLDNKNDVQLYLKKSQKILAEKYSKEAFLKNVIKTYRGML